MKIPNFGDFWGRCGAAYQNGVHFAQLENQSYHLAKTRAQSDAWFKSFSVNRQTDRRNYDD